MKQADFLQQLEGTESVFCMTMPGRVVLIQKESVRDWLTYCFSQSDYKPTVNIFESPILGKYVVIGLPVGKGIEVEPC